MPNSQNILGLGAPMDLGLGDTLSQQVMDETEEEKRRRKLGLSLTQQNPLMDYGRTGVASVDLGVRGAAGR